jgi:hypothetical protein
MRLILIILLTFPLITISCIDSSFQKEIQFVQSIINHPDSIQSLIESSEFYDSTLYTSGHSYQKLADYLRNDSIREVKIADYYYLNGVLETKNHEFLDSIKCVDVKCHIYFKIGFYFKEINNQTKLKVIGLKRNLGD